MTGTKAGVAGCEKDFKGEMMAELNTGQKDLIGRIEGNVAILSFNRPEVRNALSEGVYAGFETALPQIASNRDVHVLMITGEGSAFCAGGDVKQMNASHKEGGSGVGGSSIEDRVQGLRHRQNLVSAALRKLPQPVVAALPGAAAGAGLSIALAADIRIAAERAILMTAFSNVAGSGDFGSSWFLPRLVGESKAKELLFMSPRLSAEEAYEMGLVNVVMPDDNFAHGALMWCQELAERAPIALRYMKENINRAGDVTLQAALDAEANAMVRTMATADHREAAAAFVEKRAPRFTGQ
jgi:2-(1,2-epoxy-1,2-dihydrophenyl)acetyl-CoA isomerase